MSEGAALRLKRAGDRQEPRLVRRPDRRAIDREQPAGAHHHQRIGEVLVRRRAHDIEAAGLVEALERDSGRRRRRRDSPPARPLAAIRPPAAGDHLGATRAARCFLKRWASCRPFRRASRARSPGLSPASGSQAVCARWRRHQARCTQSPGRTKHREELATRFSSALGRLSIVSRLIDRKVASAISSISSSTRCSAPPMSVSSPGSFARWPGAGSNRATMSIRVVRRRLPMKR